MLLECDVDGWHMIVSTTSYIVSEVYCDLACDPQTQTCPSFTTTVMETSTTSFFITGDFTEAATRESTSEISSTVSNFEVVLIVTSGET